MKKNIITTLIMIVLLLITLVYYCMTNEKYVDVDNREIYDVILFWGQSNMVGTAGKFKGKNGKLGEDSLDSNISKVGGNEKFSELSGIDLDIVNNYTSIDHVDVDIKPGTVYEYYYGNDKLIELNGKEKTIGERILTTVDNKGKIKSIVTDGSDISIRGSRGTNLISEFARKYNEETGHKVVIVFAALGGQELGNFLPKNLRSRYYDYITEDYNIYETMTTLYNNATNYMLNNNLRIGNRLDVVMQGEADTKHLRGAYSTYYEEEYMLIHDSLKHDIGIDFSVIIETSYTMQLGFYDGITNVHKAQENLIRKHKDIILGSDMAYTHYLPSITKTNYSKKEYDELLNKYLLLVCNSEMGENLIHFNSAALSQIGREAAINTANHLKTLES